MPTQATPTDADRERLSHRDAEEITETSRQGVIAQLRRVLGLEKVAKDRSALLDLPQDPRTR